jgi:DNA-binding cell septation regulator SpoVG
LAHPINDPTRKYLTEVVMAEYHRELANPTAHTNNSSSEEQHAY